MIDTIVLFYTEREGKEWVAQRRKLDPKRCLIITPRRIDKVRGHGNVVAFHNPAEIPLGCREVAVILACFNEPRMNRSRVLRDFVLRQVTLT